MQSEQLRYYDDYIHYQSFDDIEQLNEAVRLSCYYYADQLGKSPVVVLKLLSRFSCVIPGVSWMKVSTIAKHIDKSEKTVRRALKTLDDLGIIKRIPTVRKQGGRGYDICIIQDVQSLMSSRTNRGSLTESKVEKGEKQIETLTSNNQRTYVREPKLNELDASFIPNSYCPEEFVTVAKPFMNAKTISDLWKRVEIASHNCKITDVNVIIPQIIKQFKGTVFIMKNNPNKIKCLYAYWYVSIVQIMLQYQREQYFQNKQYNWLTA
ncbi:MULTISPECIES: helix-turn-helix domain-containing protein [Bacillaceae]|uniref:Helix-turn-helix domain-containing protein n=1 Tax=Evansella alkalicola TaxID=745819 RepID=A0ABS6JZY7_9BACI|nr:MULTISPECIES: helix-turn-helix domain-containing protein [Bacillaceae]MBU9724149.1 hypothetical protein [Bacillus alkalicola]